MLVNMKAKQLHYTSGLIITIFIALHLFNHAYSIAGIDAHIHLMKNLRLFYRNIIAETILLMAVVVQIISGLLLFKINRKIATTGFEKLHIYTGLYLAFFLIIHVGAVLTGRFYLHLDTNFYFGVAGINTFPLNLFFIPYYSFAVIAFFGHIASVHHKKMKNVVLGISPDKQAMTILLFGIAFTPLLFYGLTNHFKGVPIPETCNVLIGK